MKKQHVIWSNTNILSTITSNLNISELHLWRQCNKRIKKSVTNYLPKYSLRLWEYMERQYKDIVGPLKEFVKRSDSAITGSVALKILSGDTWENRDIDIICRLDKDTISHFITLIKSLSPMLWIIKYHDSLNDDDHDTIHYRSLIQPIRELKLTRNNHQDSHGYEKHVRSVYFTLELVTPETKDNCAFEKASEYEKRRCTCKKWLSDQENSKHKCAATHYSIDFLFVPDVDVDIVGNLTDGANYRYAHISRWMYLNFDYQMCANAITTDRVYCLAPNDILNRCAILRCDQYCCYPTLTGVNEFNDWDNDEGYEMYNLGRYRQSESRHISLNQRLLKQKRCMCPGIVFHRIIKYRKRGYKVESGFVSNT